MAARLFHFLGKGLGIYARENDPRENEDSSSDDSDEYDQITDNLAEIPAQPVSNDQGLVEQLLSSVPKSMRVTRADVKEALASTGHDLFQTALILKSRAPPVPKPPILTRSLSENIYEDLGRIHSLQAVRKALDTSGRENPTRARRVLEQNTLNYNRYCCTEIQQDEEEKYPELECALCYVEFEAKDTNLLRLPCGLQICRTCLQGKIADDIRKGGHPMCPGTCNKGLLPSIVNSSMRDLCGLCGRKFVQFGLEERPVRCCHEHAFCVQCLAEHVKGSIRLKISPVCPRSSECHYTLAVPEVRDILERSAAKADTLKLADATVWSMRTYFSQMVPPHITQQWSPFKRDCFNPLCHAQMDLPDDAVVARLRGDRVEAVGECRQCHLEWCLACCHVGHSGLSCAAAERMAGRWQEFMSKNPRLFVGCELARKLRQSYEEEKLTCDRVRRCPHCKKGPIYKIDGCNMMVCGSDAVDKRSSNTYGSWQRYRGCQRSFNWSDALRCRPDACHGKPAGSVALAESVGTKPFDIFFRECLTDRNTKAVLSLIARRYVPLADRTIVQLGCEFAATQDPVVGLIAAKAQVDNVDGASPLIIACKRQWSEVVLALVAAKASVSRQKDGKTPLLQACASLCSESTGRPDVIAALLGAGADPTACLPNGNSPLLLACETPAHPECIAVLAKAGAALNIRRHDGQTPLLLACAKNSAGAVANLLGAKADVNMGVAGCTPVLAACRQSDPRCVQSLLEAKADAHVKDCLGRGPVALISQHSKASLPERRDTSCVQALVRAKAHISVDHGDWQVVVRDHVAFTSALEMARDDITVFHNNCLDAVAALILANAESSGHIGEIAVLTLATHKVRTRPLQQLLAVSETENSFHVRFSFTPPDNRAHVRLSIRQIMEAGPSDASDEPARREGSTNRMRHREHEKLFGVVHRNTPHGKAAGRSEFVGRQKSRRTGPSESRNKRKSKPKRAWHALRGKRMYQREWSRG